MDISTGDQFKPEFLAISPNNKIPAIVDRNGPGGKPYSLFESGAILLYLAEKTGKFLPKTERGRHDVIQWLMFQMGNIGPMLGQAGHFRNYASEKIPYAINRYTNEANRLYGVMDKRLGKAPYLAGAYSIADMAVWPWLRYPDRHGVNVDDFPNVKRWREAIAARPAVQRGLKILAGKSAHRADGRQGQGNPLRRHAVPEAVTRRRLPKDDPARRAPLPPAAAAKTACSGD